MATGYKFPDEAGDDVTDVGVKGVTAVEDDIQVDIVDDTPEGDRGRPALQEEVADPTDEELGQYSAAVQARIKKLTHKGHDERRAKEAAMRERDELDRFARVTLAERDRLKTLLGEGTEVLSTQAKTLADGDVATAKAALRAAHEAFDNDAIVEAQEKLNAAQIKRERIENSRPAPFQPEKMVVDSQPSIQATAPRLDDRTQKWMAANKWFGDGGDEAMTGYALGLHQRLVKDHGEPYTRTAEYYSQIDTAMRRTFPDTFKAGSATPRTLVAPASRSTANVKRVQLTSTQVALAKRYGLTNQQYAAEVMKLESSND